MGNWARIHQKFGKNSNEVTKRGSLTNGNYKKKMANLSEKGKRQKAKMESSRVWPITNEMTKRGIWTNDNFIKFINLARNFKKFGKKLSRMTKEACQ